MSDKPTGREMIDVIQKNTWISSGEAAELVRIIKESKPEWFAPEPDPVERYTNSVCERCCNQPECDNPEIEKSEMMKQCRANRDALRAYVAELRRKAGEK